MIKIGDFSKLAHVSIKTLHHYDDLGLLKPVHVDRNSGYRYYEIGQLSRLNPILAQTGHALVRPVRRPYLPGDWPGTDPGGGRRSAQWATRWRLVEHPRAPARTACRACHGECYSHRGLCHPAASLCFVVYLDAEQRLPTCRIVS